MSTDGASNQHGWLIVCLFVWSIMDSCDASYTKHKLTARIEALESVAGMCR